MIKHANFNFKNVSPVSVRRKFEVPALFGHSKDDHFIPFEQCQRLYIHYQSCNKKIIELEGGHNGKRSEDWIRSGVCFVFLNFGLMIKNPSISTCRRLQEKVSHFSSFSQMVGGGNLNEDIKKCRNVCVPLNGCRTRKRRKSLREKEFDLKKLKKNSSKKKDDDINSNDYYKFILGGENDSSDESDVDNIDENECIDDDSSDESVVPENNCNNGPNKVFTVISNYNDFILGGNSNDK